MYTQFFGNFLLSRGVVTSEQLIEAIQEQSSTHLKLGTLAIHAGFMTASEADNIIIMQTHQDKRFGELAIEGGYLTEEQVNTLLKMQKPDYLLLGQSLIKKGIISNGDFENLITDYQSENEILDLDMAEEQKDTITDMLANYCDFNGHPQADKAIEYLNLLFNNLIRFIGDDFTLLNPMPCPEFPTNYSVLQITKSDSLTITSVIDMDQETASAFASRYMNESFSDFNDYAKASLEDFLNLHNGLFNVNLSNDFSEEFLLEPPHIHQLDMLTFNEYSYLFPIIYPFGTISFIFAFSE